MDHHEIEIEEVISPEVTYRCLNSVRHTLEQRERGRGRSFEAQAPSCTISGIPEDLCEIDPRAVKPELVSIGPYHRKDCLELKPFLLERFLRRTNSSEASLFNLLADAARRSALDFYSELRKPLDDEFVKMMLFDGCFVVELLLHVNKNDPIFARRWIIPILIRDLLKLENQVPYSLLQSIFDYSAPITPSTSIEARTPHLSMLALRVFNLGYSALRDEYTDLQYRHYDVIKERRHKHLLDLFYFALLSAKDFNQEDINLYFLAKGFNQEDINQYFLAKGFNQEVDALLSTEDVNREDIDQYFAHFPAKDFNQEDINPYFALFTAKVKKSFRPSVQSMPCVTQLRPSGITFKAKNTVSFLDISLRNRVLEIPTIAIDDFMITVLINCIALEQCQESRSKPITDYVSFMRCLINQPKDVSLLCSDGIISVLSFDYEYVVNLFNKLGKNIVFNVNNCYLSKQFEELESYHNSNRAILIRTYCSSPWAAVSVFSAFLIIALTVTQTVYAVLGR